MIASTEVVGRSRGFPSSLTQTNSHCLTSAKQSHETRETRSLKKTRIIEPSFRLRLARRLRPVWKVTGPTWWAEHRWKLIGLLWLVALITGFIGFNKQAIHYDENRSWSDVLYQTLQLPIMQSGLVQNPVNGWLDFARFFAPLMTLLTGLQAAVLLLGERIQGLRLRYFCTDHVVICGLGRKGTLLAERFRNKGDRLVLIEQDQNNSSAKRFREEGTIVLIGDAQDSTILRKARVGRAKWIVCVCSDDETNAQICAQSWDLSLGEPGPAVTCLVHIVSPELCELLRLETIKRDQTGRFRVEFFNIFQTGAWALLDQYPPFDENTPQVDKAPHIVIVGLGRFGAHVLLRAAKRWRNLHTDSKSRLRVTVVDKDADRKTKALSIAYPNLQTVCDVTPKTLDIQSAEFEADGFLLNAQGGTDTSRVYVCFSDQSLGLRAALSIHDRLRGAEVPILVRMSDARGLSRLLDKKGENGSRFAWIRPFNLYDITCDVGLVHGVATEILARAIHAYYFEGMRSAGRNVADKPAAAPWEDLPEFLKESNRRQAHHIGAKLDAVGCSLAPLRAWDAEPFRFTPQEEEKLSRMEHVRWWDERIAEGWRKGPRDDKRKRHPDMVPWEQLTKEAQDLDRQVVLNLPHVLAAIDLQIYRVA